ncbi:MAG: MBOAT family protein [Alphaproteobacteria bacterium]|nr:MBOAT family protein [Alphaproteobacteria bacterium]
MLFNDSGFLFLFLPATVIAFFVAPRRLRVWALIVSSLTFYGMSGLDHLAVMMVGIVVVYLAAARDFYGRSRLAFTIAVATPLLALTYYKYTGFILGNLRAATGEGYLTETFSLFGDVLLPAGISFFTFQLVSFAIDRWRGDIPVSPKFESFVLYISFFPQLVAGPILRWAQVEDRIHQLSRYRPDSTRVIEAIEYIVLGLASKVIIADGIDNLMAPLAAAPDAAGIAGGLFVVFGYSFQIYFDFYGYSLVAIGLGKIFGFDFPANFLRPYQSLNPREFWRRWHTTLSYWIRDYLYIPLGGNRRYWRNILIVFAATGMWHGAGWNFVVWGLYHACLILGFSVLSRPWGMLPKLIQRGLTFSLVSFGWLLFLYDFGEALALAKGVVGLGLPAITTVTPLMWLALFGAGVVCFGVHYERIIEGSQPSTRVRSIGRAVTMSALLIVTILFFDQSKTFIYFRF